MTISFVEVSAEVSPHGIPHFDVFEDGEFIGHLINDFYAASQGWYFYRHGNNTDEDCVWRLCSVGEENVAIAKWKFRRMYFARVVRDRS